MFKFGIEHEVAFFNREGYFADFISTSVAEFDTIIASLPIHEQDYPSLRVGDAGIRKKRWYLEGLERFNTAGDLIGYLPKGIEIRTTPHPTIQGAVEELTESFRLLCKRAAQSGFAPVLTSFNPYRTTFVPDPPFNDFENALLKQSPEDWTSTLAMLTYGPDLNISCQGLSTDAIIDIGRKLTYYSPYIVPFSYSSPFLEGTLWDGLSARTFVRTGIRPAALVFLGDKAEIQESSPSLTKLAHISEEIGRIEFKACDSCNDFAIYAGLLTLLKGLILDTTLPGRATVPDAALHQKSAQQGFANDDIATGTQAVLQAAKHALDDDEDIHLLEPLHRMLQQGISPAHSIIQAFKATGSVDAALRSTYPTYHEYLRI
jgi:gamma-glutamyl:cysteine ligase YbdK (ATP-grasp superfamily)